MKKEYRSGALPEQDETGPIALPAHVAGSGTLDRLVDTARDHARATAHALLPSVSPTGTSPV